MLVPMSDEKTITYSDDIAYNDDTAAGAITVFRRLASVMDLSPFLLWTEQEADGFGPDFAAVAPDLPRSHRARRLSNQFAFAVEAGMPETTQLSLLADWVAVLLQRMPDAPLRPVLAQAIEMTRVAVAVPCSELAVEELREMLENNEREGEGLRDDGNYLGLAAVVLRGAVWRFIHRPEIGPSTPFELWIEASEVLGAIARLLKPAQADDAYAACARALSAIYRWSAPVVPASSC
jgi:hypothetical protein